jgi:hypothetical protein
VALRLLAPLDPPRLRGSSRRGSCMRRGTGSGTLRGPMRRAHTFTLRRSSWYSIGTSATHASWLTTAGAARCAPASTTRGMSLTTPRRATSSVIAEILANAPPLNLNRNKINLGQLCLAALIGQVDQNNLSLQSPLSLEDRSTNNNLVFSRPGQREIRTSASEFPHSIVS